MLSIVHKRMLKWLKNTHLINTSRFSSSLLDKKIARIERLQKKKQKIENEFASKTSEPLHPNAVHYQVCKNGKTIQNPLNKGKLPDIYDPQFVESGWYDWWKQNQTFAPQKENVETFSMVIPPPNVTGNLHLGHALTITLEDILCRWNRMNGKKVVWIPGCDHAGIATQAIVEKHLAQKPGTNRNSLSKDEFLNEIWKWKNEKQNNIFGQIERMGASLNWDQSVFTLDPNYTKAVTTAFIKLYEKKLIYRDLTLVNWCCHLQTTISNIEVDYIEIQKPTDVKLPSYDKPVTFGIMHSIAYKLVDPSENITEIVVATTRLETIFGDVAIAVHPDDNKFNRLIGKYVHHPLVKDTKLPIIGSTSVNPDLGTGAVKITPAHDFRDFEVGKQLNLGMKTIFDNSGCLRNTGNSEYDGLPRFHGRKKVIKELKKLELYRGHSPHITQIPRCSRSGDVIEPTIKAQWFVDTTKLSKELLDSGKLTLLPSSHVNNWNNWLKGGENWCISRQLWWGHRIPAYCVDGNEDMWVVAENSSKALQQAKLLYGNKITEKNLVQDGDVLDTWFSSALYPFVTMGWPNSLNKNFYPLDVMETGYDLMFFWVAKMAMLGLALTDQIPFKVVYFHPLVRDAHGRKMSKSLGNVIDPLNVIDGIEQREMLENINNSILTEQEKIISQKEIKKFFTNGIPACGTDALRLSLAIFKSSGTDLNFNVNNVIVYRKFCNKIWNAFKFLTFNAEKNNMFLTETDQTNLRPIDLWIRSRLSSVHIEYERYLKSYKFSSAALLIYNFWLKDICDVYIESCKKPINEDPIKCNDILNNLSFIIDGGLRLLSPFMPYITEELWQRLTYNDKKYSSISLSPFLSDEFGVNEKLENEISQLLSIIQSIRSTKQTFQLSRECEVTISCETKLNFLNTSLSVIKDLCNMKKISLSQNTPSFMTFDEEIILNENIVVISFHLHQEEDLNGKAELIKKRIEKLLKKKEKIDNENEQTEINLKLKQYMEFVNIIK